MTGLTVQRIELLAQIEQIADQALEIPPADRINVFHSLCRHIATDGGGYTERITAAAYALAISEDNLQAALA